MPKYLQINVSTDAYDAEDILHNAMTVQDLIQALSKFDQHDKVILNNGIRYGVLRVEDGTFTQPQISRDYWANLEGEALEAAMKESDQYLEDLAQKVLDYAKDHGIEVEPWQVDYEFLTCLTEDFEKEPTEQDILENLMEITDGGEQE